MTDQAQVGSLLMLVAQSNPELLDSAPDTVYIKNWLASQGYAVEPTPSPTLVPTATPAPTAVPTATPAPTAVPKKVKLSIAHANAFATHEANSRGISFEATNLLDGSDKTSWQYDITETGGYDPYIDLELAKTSTVATLVVRNGYWKVSSGLDQYTRNGRVESFEVSFRYAGQSEFTDAMQFYLTDERAEQSFDLGWRANVEAVRITIQSIYQGTKFPDDVAINELKLMGVQ